MSVHVYDPKGAALRKVAESLLKYFEEKVGKCKADFKSFSHTGIAHEHDAFGVYTHINMLALRPLIVFHHLSGQALMTKLRRRLSFMMYIVHVEAR